MSLSEDLIIDILERVGNKHREWVENLSLEELIDFHDYLNEPFYE